MQQLRLNPNLLRQRSNEYSTEHQKINDVIVKLDKLIGDLQNEWEGKAAIAFINQYQNLKPSFTQMAQLVETISNQIRQTANVMEQLDIDIAAKIK